MNIYPRSGPAFPGGDGDDEDLTTIEAPARALAEAREPWPAPVPARTGYGVSDEDAAFGGQPGAERRGFATLDDEKTFVFPLRAAPPLPDGSGGDQDEDSTLDQRQSAEALGLYSTAPRGAVLPRRRGETAAPLGPRFDVKGTLGRGAGGEVLLQFDRDIERHVAVKRVTSDDPGMLLRFADEIRTIGGLEHPNIVPIHDVGIDEDHRHYFVMRYVEGETLERIIKRLAAGDAEYERRYTPDRRAEICMEVMKALAYAHARGVIHRDIKPANIMVGAYGEVMLMDWGVAKRLRAPRGEAPAERTGAGPADAAAEAPADEASRLFETRAGTLIGTPYYMSPEQASGNNAAIDERSDIYSLSVVIHELFTLRHYLAGRNTLLSVIDGIKAPDRPYVTFVMEILFSRLPSEIMHFVRKGMRKAPAERYQSMSEMMERFQAAREGRFRVQCYFTFIKRCAQGLLHFVDAHPLVTTALFVGFVVGVPSLLALLLWHRL